jgi:hypothetical protein
MTVSIVSDARFTSPATVFEWMHAGGDRVVLYRNDDREWELIETWGDFVAFLSGFAVLDPSRLRAGFVERD